MKRLICFFTLLLTVATLNNVVFAAEPKQTNAVESGIETVPLGKSLQFTVSTATLRVLGTWNDGSGYQPLLFFTANIANRTWLKKGFGEKVLLVLDVAVKSREPMKFLLKRDLEIGEDPIFYALSFRGTTFDLNSGEVYTKGPEQVARVPSRVPEKEKLITGVVEYRTPKSFTLPNELTDYTVHMDYIWGIFESSEKVQVFLDDRILVVAVGPSDYAPNTVFVSAKFRDAEKPAVEKFRLVFKKQVSLESIEWCHVSTATDLKPFADKLVERIKSAKRSGLPVQAPMAERLLSEEASAR